jgi:hypothetical protein
MTNNTLALTLTGEVPLAEFAEAMGHFSSLINALTNEIGEEAEIEWEISRLEAGSATAVIIGRSTDASAIEKIIRAYEVIGNAIHNEEPIPYSEPIAREAIAITGLLNDKIKSVEFKTEGFAAAIDKPVSIKIDDEPITDYSFGTVTGMVETLSKRGKMRFVLYDSLFDRAVECFLGKGQEHLMLDAWDKRILVAGRVVRDPINGRPTNVHDINYIEVQEESPIDFESLAGILPWKEGDEYPEVTIRRMRDGE